MARTAPSVRRRRGGALRALGLVLLALAAALAVAVAMFPFARLAPALAARLSRETGLEVRVDALDVGFGTTGPTLALGAVTLQWPSGERLVLKSLGLRPARPLAWLRGVPTARVDLDAAFGAFRGDVSRALVQGELARFDFAQLPATWFGPAGAPIAGAVDARVDFARADDAWTGHATLTGGEGSLALPGAPIAIPYDQLAADATLDAEGTLRLASLTLAGPMISARASGTVAAGPSGPASGAIDVVADVAHTDPALLPSLTQLGLALDASGAGRIAVTGTADQVELR